MSYQRIDRWTHIIGALGIVAGLVLVAIELSQGRRLARAELGSGSIAYRQSLLESIQGEGLAAALAQSIEEPAGLSVEQQIILDAWYDDVMGQVLRQRYLLRLGIFKNPLEPFARIQARAYFGNAYAQAWWQRNRDQYPQELVAIMAPVIETLTAQRDRLAFQQLREEATALTQAGEANPP
jgi:hypothetical protein